MRRNQKQFEETKEKKKSFKQQNYNKKNQIQTEIIEIQGYLEGSAVSPLEDIGETQTSLSEKEGEGQNCPKEISLSQEQIYQGNLILVNQFYPVRFQCSEDGKNEQLYAPFPKQPEILMESNSAHVLQKLLEEVFSSEKADSQMTEQKNFGKMKNEASSMMEKTGFPETAEPIVGVSGYRSREEQIAIFEDSLKENGRIFTETYVAFPDHSEHQTGLAIDLAENKPEIDFIRPDFPYEGICQQFRQKAASYGFIERYPKEKQEITGIGQEPWHFRYVGVPHAEIMKKQDMVLEEYTEWLKQFVWNEKPLKWESHGKKYLIGYVKSKGSTTKVKLPENAERNSAILLDERNEKSMVLKADKNSNGEKIHNLEISGNNMDGFVITYTITQTGGNECEAENEL